MLFYKIKLTLLLALLHLNLTNRRLKVLTLKRSTMLNPTLDYVEPIDSHTSKVIGIGSHEYRAGIRRKIVTKDNETFSVS